MDWWQILLLAVVQGLTEFLPISSSAHLILLPHVFSWPDQGLAFDVAAHVGSLAAVIIYFRTTLQELLQGWWRHLRYGEASNDSRLAWSIAFASIPVALCGWLFQDLVSQMLRNPLVIAAATLFFGLVLWAADRWCDHQVDEYNMGWRRVAIIGLAQALALIPGTSRSGITMTAGLGLGLTRAAAARFSFLLSIPVILMAGGYNSWRLAIQPGAAPWAKLLVAAAVSGIVALLCIHFFLKWVERVGMMPFVVYRVVLAAVLFIIFI